MVTKIEQAVAERESQAAKLTWLEEKIKLDLNEIEIDLYLEKAALFESKIIETHEKVVNLAPADIDDHELKHVALSDRCQTILVNLKMKAKTLAAASKPLTITTTTSSKVKLPQIKLPTFSGDITEWISYRDMFVSTIHDDTNLSAVQKLTYLKSTLLGEAANLIKTIPISDSSYATAWDIVKNRFENKRELYFATVRKFCKLHTSSMETAQGLRTLIDSANECTRTIDTLSIPDKWDSMLLYLVANKLDQETRQLWERTLKDTEIPKCKVILDFIEQQARAIASTSKPKKHSELKKPHAFHARVETEKKGAGHKCCKICSENHPHYHCPVFIAMAVPERQKEVKSKKLCHNCLRSGHDASQCNSHRRCFKCSDKHHSLLHNVREPEKKSAPRDNLKSHHTHQDEAQTILATAQIRAEGWTGEPIILKALLDGGSTASFISESCVNKLGLKRKKANEEVVGLSSSVIGTTRGLTTLKFKPHFKSEQEFQVNAFIMQEVTSQLPLSKLDSSKWTHLNNLQMADPTYNIPMDIDLLLGADIFYDLLDNGRKTGPRGTPTAQNSKLGWLVVGSIGNAAPRIRVHNAEVRLHESLQKFWEIEAVPKANLHSADEKVCEAHFMDTHTRDASGRYVVQIPMKSPEVRLGQSRETAVRRFLHIEKKMHSKPKVRDLYVEFMQTYIKLGHMVKIPETTEKSKRVYLPHHFVLKDEENLSKFRVVFDASAKTASGNSLNDAQLVGPTIQDSLVTLLMRFRMNPIAFTADITKMYRQILVEPEQQDLQCIIWREAPNLPLQEFKLLTVTYGTASGSFLATRTLQQLAEDEECNFPLAAPVVKNSFYMDDCMSGAQSTDEAKALIQQLRGMTEAGGFSLRKFASNCPEALKNVPADLRESNETLSLEEDDEIIKTLGLHWNTRNDEFQFKVKIEDKNVPVTKRNLLSQISKIFDPMGWLSPTIITTKIMMQEVWKEEIAWDEAPSTDILSQWTHFKLTLQTLENIRIPRCVYPSCKSTIQLHGFSDASEKAYAAVIYSRVLQEDGKYLISIITSKSKVAPVSIMSIPRLELCGALLLAELMEAVQNSLQVICSGARAWTDSKIVLDWLKSNPSRWKTFVANRVAKIQEIMPYSQWGHVPGIDNPADCASRGIQPAELVHHSLWWNGPKWLQDDVPAPASTAQNSQVPASLNKEVENEERIRIFTAKAHVMDFNMLTRYSTLQKLKRVTAWCLRFYHKLKEMVQLKKKQITCKTRLEEFLTVPELENALDVWVKSMQASVFQNEIVALSQNKPISTQSRILALSPFLDKKGILRVGGRLCHAKLLTPERKNPILFPRHHRLTELLILNTHLHTYHGGTQLVLNVLHQGFWIVRARDAVTHQIRKCIVCTRHRAAVRNQLMGNLPETRITPCRPFSKTGVDYAGPFLLRAIPGRSKITFKAYIALFICFVTRGIHLEIVSSLSTEAFLAALRRFTGRRGCPTDMFSDCGTNFMGAAKELKELLALTKSTPFNVAVANHLSKEGINWHFNPPSAPHFGGLWEAGVKSVKSHLNRVLGPVRMTFEEMSTVTIQIEACLNSRPLTYISTDPLDLTALTPAHFLVGHPLRAMPDPDLTSVPENRLNRWQMVQLIQQHFWRRWSAEYLTRLQQRPKWLVSRPQIQIGDLVLVKDEDVSPTHWPLARVVEIHPGSDGLTRVVTLRTAKGEMKRPIVKLCILPIEKSDTPTTSAIEDVI